MDQNRRVDREIARAPIQRWRKRLVRRERDLTELRLEVRSVSQLLRGDETDSCSDETDSLFGRYRVTARVGRKINSQVRLELSIHPIPLVTPLYTSKNFFYSHL